MNERDESMGDDSNSSLLPDFSFVCQNSNNMSINEQPIKVWKFFIFNNFDILLKIKIF